MGHNFSHLSLQDGAFGSLSQLRLWRDRLPAGLWSRYWQGIVSTLAILGLLVAFHQVVQGAVKQGQSHVKATALHAEANWRCNSLPDLREREACLVQLKADRDDAGLSSRDLAKGE